MSFLAVGTSSLPPNLNSNTAHLSSSSPTHSKKLLKANTTLLQTCKTIESFPQIHSRIIKSGQDRNPRVLFKILRHCSALDSMHYAEKIFENIKNPDVYHYAAMIGGKIDASAYLDAVRLYQRMVDEPIEPDLVAVSYVLKACSLEMALIEGRQVHGQVVKLRLGGERAIRMRLLEFYGKCGEFGDARLVFGEMPDRDAVAGTILITCYFDHGSVDKARGIFDEVRDKDTVCWTAMINGLVRTGKANAALELFRRMQRENVQPNEFTVVCVLLACSQLGALELGRWVHSFVGKNGIRLNNFVGSTLIDMYSKCGCLEEAKRVFNEMPKRDVVSYNSMITGLAMHGRSGEAVGLYHDMLRQGLRPTNITFVGVLNACSHGGLVEEGFEIFESMIRDYGLEPRVEHYGCMVDLLGRIGRLEEAYKFVKQMRIDPDHVIWGALLGACKIHRNLTLGERVAGILMGSKTADSGTYVLLANVFASFGKWDESVRIRAKMKEQGIRKEPGCSLIEVHNEIHEFLLGDIRHHRRDEIYKKLEELNGILKSEGYFPAREVVLQDIEEGEKEWALSIHSERLAISYGLISTEPGMVIRVMKNLRICGDCHSMIKLIAKVTKRKIVVRDRNRFHHFEDGSCSCGDYW